jgi:CBS domain-containing protein
MSPTLTTKPEARSRIPLTAKSHLDVEVRHVMTPGVITISEDVSLHETYRALVVHRVHAVLVTGRSTGKPLGWVTARGLLSWVMRDESMACARDGITHPAATIQPGATVREALTAIQQPGITQLLVGDHSARTPEGVLSDVDLIALVAR